MVRVTGRDAFKRALDTCQATKDGYKGLVGLTPVRRGWIRRSDQTACSISSAAWASSPKRDTPDANDRAALCKALSPSMSMTAAPISAGAASGESARPSPSASTRAALSFWSRPLGRHRVGLPAPALNMIVPKPACVTTRSTEGSTASCGTKDRASTSPETGKVPGAIPRPVVTSTSIGKADTASQMFRNVACCP